MYITLCGKKREETEKEKERQRCTCIPWMSITVEMSADLEPISVSPKVLTKWRVFRFWFRLRWEIPQLFWLRCREGVGQGGRHLLSIFNQTLTAFTDRLTWLCDCSISITSAFVIHQETLFDFHIPPTAPSVYAPLYIVFIFGCLINFVTNVQQLRSVRKLQPICKEYRTKN